MVDSSSMRVGQILALGRQGRISKKQLFSWDLTAEKETSLKKNKGRAFQAEGIECIKEL